VHLLLTFFVAKDIKSESDPV